MNNEITWKNVIGFEGLYLVNNKGDVLSLLTNKILKQGKNSNHYYIVVLCKNKRKYTRKVHRLVAEAFIPNPDSKPEVNHIKCVTKECCINTVENLEWVTRKENYLHCKKLNRYVKPPVHYGKYNNASHKVIQKDCHGNLIKRWDCVREVCEHFNIERHSLRNKILNSKQINGFYFEYDDNEKR